MMDVEIEAQDFREGDMFYRRDVGYVVVDRIARTGAAVAVSFVVGNPGRPRDVGAQCFDFRDKVQVRR